MATRRIVTPTDLQTSLATELLPQTADYTGFVTWKDTGNSGTVTRAAVVAEISDPINERISDVANATVVLRHAVDTDNLVKIDRTLGKIYFPRIAVSFPNDAVSPFQVTPGGGAATTFELDFSLTDSVYYHYYIDMTGTPAVKQRSATKDLPATGTYIPLGNSHNGAFATKWGFRVRDVGDEERFIPRRARTLEAMRRSAEMLPIQTVQTGGLPLVVTTTNWFELAPMMIRSTVRATVAAKFNLSHVRNGQTITCLVQNDMTFFAGYGRTFFGHGVNNQLVVEGPGLVDIRNVGDQIIATVVAGSPTWSVITEPVMTEHIHVAGQSQMVRFYVESGIGGFAEATRDVDWLTGGLLDFTRYWSLGATGGTSLLKASLPNNTDEEADSDAWWYDDVLPENGPALTTCLAALTAAHAAGQARPKVFWAQGESDAGAMQTGDITITRLTAGIKTVWGIIKTHIESLWGAGDLTIIQIPLGAWDGGTLRRGVSYVRAAYAQAVADTAYAVQGPEMYDLPRNFREIHMNEKGNHILGRRLARHWANIFASGTYDLGPEVSAVTLGADNRSFAAVIGSTSGTLVSPFGNVTRTRSAGLDSDYPEGGVFGFGVINTDTGATRQVETGVVEIDTAASMRLRFSLGVNPTGLRWQSVFGYANEIAAFDYIRDSQRDRATGWPGLPLRFKTGLVP